MSALESIMLSESRVVHLKLLLLLKLVSTFEVRWLNLIDEYRFTWQPTRGYPSLSNNFLRGDTSTLNSLLKFRLS